MQAGVPRASRCVAWRLPVGDLRTEFTEGRTTTLNSEVAVLLYAPRSSMNYRRHFESRTRVYLFWCILLSREARQALRGRFAMYRAFG